MMESRAVEEVASLQAVPELTFRGRGQAMRRPRLAICIGALVVVGLFLAGPVVPGPAFAQEAPAPAGASPAPGPEAGSSASGSQAAPRIADDLPTLVPSTGDGGDAEDVTLPEKPAAVLRGGESTWDDGFKNLTESFTRIQDALAKAGLKPAGRPLAVFLSADDTHFRFEAMVPLAAPFPGGGEIAPGITAGVTPSGRALRFVHKAPYDEIDTTYEAITAYLDSKNMVAKDAFIEEYPSRTMDPDDPNLEINVYVQPK